MILNGIPIVTGYVNATNKTWCDQYGFTNRNTPELRINSANNLYIEILNLYDLVGSGTYSFFLVFGQINAVRINVTETAIASSSSSESSGTDTTIQVKFYIPPRLCTRTKERVELWCTMGSQEYIIGQWWMKYDQTVYGCDDRSSSSSSLSSSSSTWLMSSSSSSSDSSDSSSSDSSSSDSSSTISSSSDSSSTISSSSDSSSSESSSSSSYGYCNSTIYTEGFSVSTYNGTYVHTISDVYNDRPYWTNENGRLIFWSTSNFWAMGTTLGVKSYKPVASGIPCPYNITCTAWETWPGGDAAGTVCGEEMSSSSSESSSSTDSSSSDSSSSSSTAIRSSSSSESSSSESSSTESSSSSSSP